MASPEARKWSALDYIVGGVYCETEQIDLEMEALRAAVDADAVLLLAAVRAGPSLTLLRILTKGPRGPLQRVFSDTEQPALLSPTDRFELPPASVVDTLADRLGPLKLSSARADALTTAFGRDVRAGLLVPARNRLVSAARVGVLVVASSRPDLADSDEVRARIVQIDLMVNAHAAIAISRDHDFERQCDDREFEVDQKASQSGHSATRAAPPGDPVAAREHVPPQYVDFAKALVEVAMTATGSTFARSYWMSRRHSDHASDWPYMSAEREPIQQGEPTCAAESIREAVVWAREFKMPWLLGQNRPVVRVDGSDRPVYRLAFPYVHRPSRSRHCEAVAVLYLEKTGGPYTAHDLAIVRAIDSHYRHSRDVVRLQNTSMLLGELTKPLPPDQDDRDARGERVGPSEEHAGWDLTASLERLIPVEAQRVRTQIQRAIDGLFRLNQARSVCFRLLAVNEPVLHRCCWQSAGPDPYHQSQIHVVRDARRSAHAAVALCGEECEIPDMRDLKADIAGAREGIWAKRLDDLLPQLEQTDAPTLSFHCSPVVCRGRLVGTVSVESVHPHAFADTRWFVSAVAAHIGQFLELGRAANEEQLNANPLTDDDGHKLAELQAEADTLLKWRDAGGRWAGEIPLEECAVALAHHAVRVASELRAFLTYLPSDTPRPADTNRVLKVLAELQAGPSVSVLKVLETIRTCVAEGLELDFAPGVREELEGRLAADGDERRALIIAFGEILSNAERSLREVGPNTPMRIAVAVDRRLPVTRCMRLRFTNLVAGAGLEEAELPAFGRRALKRARAHVGGIIVGRLARTSLGGDFYIQHQAAGEITVALELLPSGPSSDHIEATS